MTYTEFKQKQHDELNNFPMFFAFSKEQFNEGLEKLGVETSELCEIPGGGFIKKADKQALINLFNAQNAELDEFFKTDSYLIEAIKYELGNHEFCITYDPEDTLSVLGLDIEDERTAECFAIARRQYLDRCQDTEKGA